MVVQFLPDKKQDKLIGATNKTLRALSLIGAVGVILWLVSVLFDITGEPAAVHTIIGSILVSIAILAISNLFYYATSKYNNQKKRANIAEYSLHLISKGATFEQVLDKYSDIAQYRELEHKADNWAEKAADKPLKTYYD